MNILENFFSKISFHNYMKTLVLLIPPFLITGPFLPDLLVTLSSLSFLIYLIYEKKIKLLFNKPFFIFLIFFCILILSSFLSDYKTDSFLTSIGYIRFGIFIFLVSYLVNIDDQFIVSLSKILLIIFFILLFDSIFQKLTGYNILGVSGPFGRVTSLFGSDIKLGGYIARTTPLLIAILVYLRSSTFLILFSLLISIFLTFISGERTSFFMNISFALIFFIVSDISKKFKLSVILISSIFIILLMFNNEIRFRLINTTLNQINFNKSEPFFKTIKNGDNLIVSHRDTTLLPRVYHMYFETVMKIFKDNIFFGSGPSSYPYKSKENKYYTVSDHVGWSRYVKKHNENLIKYLKSIHNEKIKAISDSTEFKKIQQNPKLLENAKYKEWLQGHGLDPIDFNDAIKDKNWLKGHGYLDRDLIGFTNISGVNNHPHNTYLQLLCEVGLIGFLYILFFWCFSIYKFFFISNLYLKCLILGLIINFNPFMFTGNFFNNWISILYFYPLGFLLKENLNYKIK